MAIILGSVGREVWHGPGNVTGQKALFHRAPDGFRRVGRQLDEQDPIVARVRDVKFLLQEVGASARRSGLTQGRRELVRESQPRVERGRLSRSERLKHLNPIVAGIGHIDSAGSETKTHGSLKLPQSISRGTARAQKVSPVHKHDPVVPGINDVQVADSIVHHPFRRVELAVPAALLAERRGELPAGRTLWAAPTSAIIVPAQILSLGSLLVWLPLTPAYYAAFEWHANTRLWRRAFLGWWLALVLTGWIMFLPGVLDHFKFTDGLVGHSFIAMAGFTSSLLIFVMVQLLGEDGWIFNRSRSFYLWNGSVLAYVVLMSVAGWREGFDPTFTIVPSAARDVLYALRLVSGLLMFAASLDWFVDATTLLREPASVSRQIPIAQEETV